MPNRSLHHHSPLLRPLKSAELAVLRLLARGKTAPQIAQELGYSAYEVKANTRRLYAKLGVATIEDALARAEKLRLLDE